MIIRIVRMHFEQDKVETFLEIFKGSKDRIRAFPGCLHLELLQDHKNPGIFATFSHWESEEALDAYRESELFKSTWAQTKVLFCEKPHAYSMHRLMTATPA